MNKIYSLDLMLPNLGREVIHQLALKCGTNNEDDLPWPRIANDVLRLSDHYLKSEKLTPWQQTGTDIAYLAYFLPLNALRLRRVIEHGLQRDFFANVDAVLDFGSGLGAAQWALASLPSLSRLSYFALEHSMTAQRLHQTLARSLPAPQFINKPYPPSKDSLAVLSYSLSELKSFPQWLNEFNFVMIVDSSERNEGRKLLELRRLLIDQGFFIWAPCTHQGNCPLLESKKDWCHDRVHVELPPWFYELERHLPMKNRSLTFSYLLAAKTPPPNLPLSVLRVIGDTLKEKGKIRQAVCRGSNREFLSWVGKKSISEAKELPRGALITLSQFKGIARELRVESSDINILP